MAKIVESLTRAEPEYSQRNIQSLVRDLDSVITKLNSTFQDEVKQEIEKTQPLGAVTPGNCPKRDCDVRYERDTRAEPLNGVTP